MLFGLVILALLLNTMLSLKQTGIFRWFGSSTIRNELRSGARVSLISSGQAAQLVEKKGPWWTAQLLSGPSQNNIIKIRENSFTLAGFNDAPSRQVKLEPPAHSPISPPHISLTNLSTPKAHAAVSKWVIFSDLHVRAASIDTCEQVATIHC